jgi:phosphoribosyl-ATP pyrophosphohydrolase/phosphoribosyl-AMP cyclohydrolase
MKPNFSKGDGLIPVIVQHATSCQVLMLGYMNAEAFEQTLSTRRVTFFSRSRNELWVKGASSGNFLDLVGVALDCDQDALLVQAIPVGPTCHTGSASCFGDAQPGSFLHELEAIIATKSLANDPESYTAKLLERGINKVAQKVGEEAVELVIEAKDNNTALFCNEAADLMYHVLVLLKAKGVELSDVEAVLRARNRSK